MKNLILTAAVVASFLALSFGRVNAQATATGHISAEVIEALTVGESSSMNFGRFSAGDQGGSLIIPAKGVAVSTSTVTTADSNINPATFSVSGSKNATFSVTLPQGPTTLTSITGEGTMMVTDWNASSLQGTDAYVLTGGNQTVSVGATLKVGTANENPTGIYTGSYQVTFAYN
jgi:hypothetical protein